MDEEIKQDVINTAKLIYDQLSTHDQLVFINEIRGVKKLTVTGRAWNQDNEHRIARY